MEYLTKEQVKMIINDVCDKTKEHLGKHPSEDAVIGTYGFLKLFLPFFIMKIDEDLANEIKIECWYKNFENI